MCYAEGGTSFYSHRQGFVFHYKSIISEINLARECATFTNALKIDVTQPE